MPRRRFLWAFAFVLAFTAGAAVDRVLAQLIGGIQSGMGYLGAANLAQLRDKARYIRVSPAGMREAAPHDVVELKTGN